MQGWEEEINKIVSELDIAIEGFNAATKLSKEDEKKLKKRMKKFVIEKEDAPEAAVEKTKKMLEEVFKAYEGAAKQSGKTVIIKKAVEKSQEEKNKSESQIKMLEALHKGFLKKYNDMMAEAQNVEKEEENKRKALIEELQNRIKVVQDDYETAGKLKIEKYRENQTLKHELSKMEPQLTTTESLFEAQLKKKEIEVDISMTTLKQKIQMMNNFKVMGNETKEKIEKAELQDSKIQPRLELLTKKEEEHKIQLARAHLTMEEYRKAIMKINGLLDKRQRQAILAKQKVKKAQEGLKDMDKKLQTMSKEEESHKEQIKMLLTLEENLRKELQA